jgi:hypothetical protein
MNASSCLQSDSSLKKQQRTPSLLPAEWQLPGPAGAGGFPMPAMGWLSSAISLPTLLLGSFLETQELPIGLTSLAPEAGDATTNALTAAGAAYV